MDHTSPNPTEHRVLATRPATPIDVVSFTENDLRNPLLTHDETARMRHFQSGWVVISAGAGEAVRACIVTELDTAASVSFLMFRPGAGWVFGEAHTHDDAVRDLAIEEPVSVPISNSNTRRSTPYSFLIELASS